MAKVYPRREATIKPTHDDWVRLATFIDGEGSILITERTWQRKYPGMYLRVVVANTDPRLCLWAQERFGGCFVIADRNRPAHHKIPYKWHVSSNQAALILEKCLPHFLLKREQAEIALLFQSTVIYGRGRGVRISPDQQATREFCKAQLKRIREERILPEQVPVN